MKEPTAWAHGINRAAWMQWIEYKLAVHKKRYSAVPRYQLMAQGALVRCGNAEQQQAAVDRAIERGWMGLFPERGRVEIESRQMSWKDL